MSEVALFDEMKLLHIDSLSDIVTRVSLCGYDAKLQLEAVLDTVTKDTLKICYKDNERTVTLPGVELIFNVNEWNDDGMQIVKYNGHSCMAKHIEAYGLHAILCSGEIICILPKCMYKEISNYDG